MSNKPLVFIQNAGYDSMDRAVDNIFAAFPLDVKDKLVWVKPNMLGDYVPERHATTHPAVIRALVKKLESLGAKVVVGDNSGIQIMVSDMVVASRTGLLGASQDRFKNISDEVVFKKIGPNSRENVAVSKIIDDCDIFISVPKMKTHLQTYITGAIKNSYGFVVGNQKPRLHMKYPNFKEFSGIVADIYNIRKPDLVIMDAVYAMEGDGPNSPKVRQLNKVFASTDGVALDHYMAKIMGMDVNKIALLKYCVENKMGSASYDLEGGDEEAIKGFKLPKTYYNIGASNSLVDTLIYRFIMGKKIAVNKKSCTLCKKCYNVCPAGAISWKDGPVIDNEKCILCFCCKEMCDQDAISFARRYVYVQKMLALLNTAKDKISKKKNKL